MDLLQAIILGILQAATEFLPVSSSGHLVLVPWLLGWPEPGLMFDTVVHWGTLLAVVVYFRRDLWRLGRAWLRGFLHWDWSDLDARLVWLLLLATVPAVIFGYALESVFESLFGKPEWVSIFLLVTAGMLALAEWRGRRTRVTGDLGWKDALVIGLAQAVAIAPGISRSGATISAGMLRGLKRPDAARFSFLLSIPIVLGAGLLPLLGLDSAADLQALLPALLAGFAVSAAVGYLVIGFLLRYLEHGTLYIFSLYCTWVGLSCLIVSWLR